MAMVDKLIEQLKNRGLTVIASDNPGALILKGPASEATPEVMAAVKKFKPELLRIYGRRPEGGKAPTEPEPERRADGARH